LGQEATLRTTVKHALAMAQAVAQLDSYQNGGERPTLYKYDGSTRLAIAKVRRKLREVTDDYSDAREKMLMELTDGAGELPRLLPEHSPAERKAVLAKHIEFSAREKSLLDAEIDLDVNPFPVAQLKLDDNPIPAGVLDLLGNLLALE
jgi:hypothetical protein